MPASPVVNICAIVTPFSKLYLTWRLSQNQNTYGYGFLFSWLQKTWPCAKSSERVSAKVIALPLPELYFQEHSPQRKGKATYSFNFKLKTEILIHISRSPLPRKKVRKASGFADLQNSP